MNNTDKKDVIIGLLAIALVCLLFALEAETRYATFLETKLDDKYQEMDDLQEQRQFLWWNWCNCSAELYRIRNALSNLTYEHERLADQYRVLLEKYNKLLNETSP